MAIPGYKILRKIRQGGMSTVYLAIQKSVDREVAIKVMSPSLAADPSFGSRFYREAKIVGQLSHPHIVSIYDVGSYKHYNFIAMDYLPGAPLQDRLDDGSISAEEAIRIVRELAAALDYAHERGYVHRDIKPDNVLFRADGSAVLCDFGIAKALKKNPKVTHSGSVLGTPHYMSPEQAQGKDIDGRADIYSLGVVFYEMLAGQVPFSGDDSVAVAVKHMTSPIPKLPASHKAFQPIIEKMMAKKVGDRFQTGKEVIAALDELQTTISHTGAAHLTHTGSTTVQVLGLASALFGTLANAISLWFKRLMLTQIRFRPNTVQLTNKQLDDIDTFIFAEDGDGEYDDLPIIQDTVEQPAIRPRLRWFRLLLLLLVVIGGGSWFYWHPVKIVPLMPEHIETDNSGAGVVAAETQPADTAIQEAASNDSLEPVPVDTEPTPAPPPEPVRYALTVNTTPDDATVRILNIKPKYVAGIKLEPGSYHIAVSATDYFPERKWVRITDRDVAHTFTLQPTRRLLSPGTELADTLSSGGKGPLMVVLPQGKLPLKNSKRTLSLSKPIAMSVHEVTFDDYLRFTAATQRKPPDDFGWGRGSRPVVDVSYNEAVAYTRWLSSETGEKYRLPTRQEWEYAAHGGVASGYWWKETGAEGKANCRRGCDSEYSKLFGSSSAPVGSYPANPFGLFDTAGNVEEWLRGCNNWQDNAKTVCLSAKVAGGSHADRDTDIHASAVKSANAISGSETIGVRLVLEL